MRDRKISVIVPAYNVEKELARTVKSILKQTYINLEVIIVNDGSTDKTEEVIKTLLKLDARIIAHYQENAGVTAARLSGVRIATGNLIGFVDGDDVIESTMYERLIDNMLKYNADISHCGYKMIFPSGRSDEYYNTGVIKEQNCEVGLKDLFEGKFIEPGLWNKVFNKELFHQLINEDIMNREIKINEDLLMNYYLFREATRSIYEDFCPYHYMVRGNSAANDTLNIHQLMDPIKVMEILLEEIDEYDSIYKIVFIKYIRQLVIKSTMSLKTNKQLIDSVRKYSRKELKRNLSTILVKNYCGIREKIIVMWVLILPSSYKLIHKIHSRITGNDKKYSLE